MFQTNEVVKTSGGDERRTGRDTCLGFIVTKLEADGRMVVRFYTSEGWRDMATVEEFDSLLSSRVPYSFYCVDPACKIGDTHLPGFPKWKILGRIDNAQDAKKEIPAYDARGSSSDPKKSHVTLERKDSYVQSKGFS